jgi:hypothetical protein
MDPNRHPHIAILIVMVKGRLSAVEDCLQRQPKQVKIIYAIAFYVQS